MSRKAVPEAAAADAGVPWWAIAVACLAMVSYAPLREAGAAGPAAAGPGAPPWGAPRRLADAGGAEGPPAPTSANITVPCVLGLISPCGNVTVGERGANLTLPIFGTKQIPSFKELSPMVKRCHHVFSDITLVVCIAVVVVSTLMTLLVPSKRKAWLAGVRRACAGDVDEAEDENNPPTPEELEEEKREALDVKSPNFIAPGNIYRVLAVLHPGMIGYFAWMRYIVKACLCAFMQLYLPIQILRQTFEQWEFYGVKSPLWFLANGFAFLGMFTAVGSLCAVFEGKCSENIRIGAKANFHILTHRAKPKKGAPAPPPDADAHPAAAGLESAVEMASGAVEAAWGEATILSHTLLGRHQPPHQPGGEGAAKGAAGGSSAGAYAVLRDEEEGQPAAKEGAEAPLGASGAHFPAWAVAINEYVWCYISMAINVVMSVLLQLCMFAKVGTFTGAVDQVALVALSLYFVFDLDAKVMESDPNLRKMYRRAVVNQTVEKPPEEHPKALMRLAAMAIGLLQFMTPLGLFSIVLLAWRNYDTGFVIGGDGFTGAGHGGGAGGH